MTRPEIRYARTSDGVSIAWAEMGQGPALLICGPTPFTHVQELPAIMEYNYGAVARSVRLITFDARGTGMSERDVADVSAATLLMDAEAVIDAAQIDRFAVFCYGNLLSLSTALQLATEHPERVTHIALQSPYQSMRDVADTAYAKAGLALAEADWPSYATAVALVLGRFDAADNPWLGQLAKAAAAWADPSVGLLYRRLEEATDVGELLARVRQPTLVLKDERVDFVPVRSSQRIAAKIPGAQFRQYSRARGEHSHDLLTAFLGLSAPTTSAPSAPSGTAIILFTDIVDSTALTERLGDTVFRTASRALDEGMRAAMREAGGTPVDGKVLGDGVMGVFTSASQAIAAARRCIELSAESELQLHVGLHAGDVTHEAGNVYGGAVNIASRICGLSAPGDLLVSGTVRDLARTSSGVAFDDRGEHSLKGIAEPVRVFAVRRDGA
ncbi:MAG: adenylate/guanylate cyclase domain-containing protein [Chloroflexota bacterium]|nr:adenylate/guanylate cyclase domain-containing protein [Chloroflexota bacterium]